MKLLNRSYIRQHTLRVNPGMVHPWVHLTKQKKGGDTDLRPSLRPDLRSVHPFDLRPCTVAVAWCCEDDGVGCVYLSFLSSFFFVLLFLFYFVWCEHEHEVTDNVANTILHFT